LRPGIRIAVEAAFAFQTRSAAFLIQCKVERL
jgi:hypothetical protein